MERKEKVCECNCGCNCSNTTGLITLILVLCILVGGALLGTCINKKIDQIHKLTIEMSYGSAENFEKLYRGIVTGDYAEKISEQIDIQLENMNAGTAEGSESSAENVNPTEEEWDGTSEEAYTLFGLSGTPGNAIVNTKTRMYKAVGGAYPKESFESAIAQVREGTAQTDDMGNAGTLTETQLAKLLDGAFYKNDNKDAEIVIIEYSDLICPFCQRHYDNRTLEDIVEADNQVALVFKNMPLDFHETADLGAKGVECAGELAGTDAYYNFLDKAFALAEQDGKFTNESLTNIASELKIDTAKFEACLNG